MRILLVEDDPVQAGVGGELLASRGHRVGIAGGIEEAREAARIHEFDLAIVDVVLGEEDGFQLVRELLERNPELRCALVTGNDVPDGEVRAAEIGARFFTKPVDFLEIVRKLKAPPTLPPGA